MHDKEYFTGHHVCVLCKRRYRVVKVIREVGQSNDAALPLEAVKVVIALFQLVVFIRILVILMRL